MVFAVVLAMFAMPTAIEALVQSVRVLTGADDDVVPLIRASAIAYVALRGAESSAAVAMHVLACFSGDRLWLIAHLDPRRFLFLNRYVMEPFALVGVAVVGLFLVSPTCLVSFGVPCVAALSALFVLSVISERVLTRSRRLAKALMEQADAGKACKPT